MLLNPQMESLTPTDKASLQNKRLHALINRAYQKIQFYNASMQALQITPDDIQTIDDIHKFPLLTGDDLSRNYPYGLLTIPVSGIARFHQSAFHRATGLSKQDLSWQVKMLARCLVSCNVTLGSVVMIVPTAIDPENRLTMQLTAESLGSTVISCSSNDLRQQLKTILNFGVTTLFANPAALIDLAGLLSRLGFSTGDLPVLQLLCETRSLTNKMRETLGMCYSVPVYSLYGHEDVMSIGIASECHEQNGLHIHEDHFYPEIIDPQTNAVLRDGQCGELVITTLSREAMPLIRYRTGDMAVLDRKPCPCGRTSARLHFLHLTP